MPAAQRWTGTRVRASSPSLVCLPGSSRRGTEEGRACPAPAPSPLSWAARFPSRWACSPLLSWGPCGCGSNQLTLLRPFPGGFRGGSLVRFACYRAQNQPRLGAWPSSPHLDLDGGMNPGPLQGLPADKVCFKEKASCLWLA